MLHLPIPLQRQACDIDCLYSKGMHSVVHNALDRVVITDTTRDEKDSFP